MNIPVLKYVSFFLTALFVPPYTVAQSIFENPVVIDMEDGLPSNFITAIAEDKEGFMWFGTDNGLCRWDGISAKVFIHDASDTNSLASDFIEPDALLWDDEQNNLLIGTSNGLSVYNPTSDKFRNYYPCMSDSSLLGNRISAIIKDNGGIIWIATDDGFARYNASTDSFINYYYQGSFDGQPIFDKVMVNITLDISQDLKNDSILWIGTRSGLLKFNKYTQEIRWFYFKTDINAPEMIHLIVDRDNRIWFSRRYGGYGFYDMEADSVHYFFKPENIGDGFYDLNCFAHGKDNIIWAGDGNKGLGFIDPDFPEKGVQSKCSTVYGLQSNAVLNVKPDEKNRIWMLTGAGLDILPGSVNYISAA